MTVRNWITSNHEKVQFITPDGVKYNFHDPAIKAVLSMSGWGLPQADIADVRGPFQHGTNPLTIRIPAREVNLNIRVNGCSRNEYWDKRYGLIEALRLNRTNLNDPSPGKLRWYRSNGTIRQLDVMIVRGPNYDPSRRGWDEHSFTEELVFRAHNPIIYDPSPISTIFDELQCSILQELVFPFAFDSDHIIFGGDICLAVNTLIVNYVGNWQEYPLITVTGPATNFVITHQQTGLKLSLVGYDIAATETVTFDLRYGRKTVTNNFGDNLLGELSLDSNLGSFALEPDPVVDDGINTFTASVENSTVDTRITFDYYNRYVGI